MSEAASRLAGENRARMSLLRLICTVSIWRTALTRVLPLCGASAWWVMLCCLVPGFILAALLRWLMRIVGAPTLMELLRRCLGRFGAGLLAAVLLLPLAVEALAELTTLMTVFTQGVGTRGTQFTLAALTGVLLLPCLHREGLARAVYLLRWGMAAAAVVLAAFLLTDAKADHLFPLYGEGNAAIQTALKAGVGMGWPIVLLLTAEPVLPGRLRGSVLPAACAVCLVLVAVLTMPHEVMRRADTVADTLLLPVRYSGNWLRLLHLCLLMLSFFLSMGGCVLLLSEQICVWVPRAQSWLNWMLLSGLVLSQTVPAAEMMRLLSSVESSLLAPLGGMALLVIPIAAARRR